MAVSFDEYESKKVLQRTGKKITINGSDTTGYDKTKVECFNCHKMGHFTREYKSPRSQESRPRNQDSLKKTVIVEDTSSKAMVAIDGAGFDWSYMGDDEVSTNIALMAFSDSEAVLKEMCDKKNSVLFTETKCLILSPDFKLPDENQVLLKIPRKNNMTRRKKECFDQEYILLPVLNTSSDVSSSNEEVESSPKDDAGKKLIAEPTCVKRGKIDDLECLDQQMKSTYDSKNTNSTNSFNTASPTVNTASDKDGTFQRTYGEWKFLKPIPTGIFNNAYDDGDEGAEADYNNLETIILVSPNPSTRIYKDHPKEQIIRANKRDQRGIIVRNKARLVAQGHRQEEGIDYDEVFAPVARIEAISLFLDYASFMDFTVYQMDVKSLILYGTIEEEIYTKIHVDNESAIYVVKNPVYHSKTKHIKIMNHFIRDSYEKRLIEMVKIHTDSNVADLLTKAFDVTSEQGKVQETAEHSRDDDDETLAETLLNIKRSLAKDKGKGSMQETELPKKLKKKEMIHLSLDEELAQKLYAEELAK
nr:copia protein [Tanacetum cinerariifolium]